MIVDNHKQIIRRTENGVIVGVVIRVCGSCFCRVNVGIVSIFVNPNPIQIINMSTFANLNPTYLLFMLDRSTRI